MRAELDLREWMLPFGTGGYAMGTVSGPQTRKYHGLLVAALKPPGKRITLLAELESFASIEGKSVALSSFQYPDVVYPHGWTNLTSCLVNEEVSWRFEQGEVVMERRLQASRSSNAIRVTFLNHGSKETHLTVRPLVCHRPLHENFREIAGYPDRLEFNEKSIESTHGEVGVDITHDAASVVPIREWYRNFVHALDDERGVGGVDDLFCPCELKWTLSPGQSAVIEAAAFNSPFHERGRQPNLTSLERAAEKFLVDHDEVSTIIAGYPWFADWGRDTMIALPGLCLETGREDLAGQILRRYGDHLLDGLIPNRFDEAGAAHYNTADATLWFVNALHQLLQRGRCKEELAAWATEKVIAILDRHIEGTRYGIGMDRSDGLLTQGEEGLQLTWMDAKVGDRVITPRPGKAVEINGLWINALRIGALLSPATKRLEYEDFAARAERSFGRFYQQELGYFADTIEPFDTALRPNQVIALALPLGPTLDSRTKSALAKVEASLLTPYGLRTLSPAHPDYKGRFEGSLAERDAAYHQGTVWPWLIGPYVSALLRIGEVDKALSALAGAEAMLDEYGIDGIAEVYDGDPPHRPGGCPWQAWSVAAIIQAQAEIRRFGAQNQKQP